MTVKDQVSVSVGHTSPTKTELQLPGMDAQRSGFNSWTCIKLLGETRGSFLVTQLVRLHMPRAKCGIQALSLFLKWSEDFLFCFDFLSLGAPFFLGMALGRGEERPVGSGSLPIYLDGQSKPSLQIAKQSLEHSIGGCTAER